MQMLELLLLLSVLAFGVDVFVLLPLAIIPATRGAGAMGLMIVSYVLGFTAWVLGGLLTLELWGSFALTVGLLTVVGVVPMAIVATLINGMWVSLVILVLLLVCTYGSRLLGLHFAECATQKPPRRSEQELSEFARQGVS